MNTTTESYWLLHRDAHHHVGPFSTPLDAATAASVALAPEVFEVLDGEQFTEYQNLPADADLSRYATTVLPFVPTQFKLWYTHQMPGPSYEQEVATPEVGQALLEAIYHVALFQFDNKMIPDYANAGGIVYLDEDGDWVDYHPDDWT